MLLRSGAVRLEGEFEMNSGWKGFLLAQPLIILCAIFPGMIPVVLIGLLVVTARSVLRRR